MYLNQDYDLPVAIFILLIKLISEHYLVGKTCKGYQEILSPKLIRGKNSFGNCLGQAIIIVRRDYNSECRCVDLQPISPVALGFHFRLSIPHSCVAITVRPYPNHSNGLIYFSFMPTIHRSSGKCCHGKHRSDYGRVLDFSKVCLVLSQTGMQWPIDFTQH